MNVEELKSKLIELSEFEDAEICHRMMDDLLLEYINDPEVTQIFNSTKKWYA